MTTQAHMSLITRAANKYVDRIRNEGKRKYAIQYWGWRRGVVSQPDPHEWGVSYMAAQAVRLEMEAIIGDAF